MRQIPLHLSQESVFRVGADQMEESKERLMDKWLGTPPELLLPRLRSLITDLELLAAPGRHPEITEAVRVRNCMLTKRAVPCLVGEFSGHPSLKDGPAVTSELFYLDRKKRIGRTLSRWYHFEDGLIEL